MSARTGRMGLCWAVACAVGCSLSLDADPTTEIRCDRSAQCPPSWVCVEPVGRCVRESAPCVERDGDRWVAASAGRACNLDDGSGGVCTDARCVVSTCGDGLVGPEEDCEEAPGGAAFANPNDGCFECRATRWQPEILLGAYSGARPAPLVAVGEVYGMAFRPDGSLYAADVARHRIWRIGASAEPVTIAAGAGVAEYSGDGGLATAAGLNGPQGVASDRIGNLYVADTLNGAIRRIGVDGRMTTVAGSPTAYCANPQPPSPSGEECGDTGLATDASLREPADVAVDRDGTVYFTDQGTQVVRRINLDGTIERVAGVYYDASGCDEGDARTSRLTRPSGIAVRDGVVYVVDTGNERVVAIDNGVLTTLAGMCRDWGNLGDGGPATQAQLDMPTDVAADGAGNVYIADLFNRRVRVVRADGTIHPVVSDVGLGVTTYAFPGQNEWTWRAIGLALDPDDRLYVSSSLERRIWRIESDGSRTLVGGDGTTSALTQGSPADAARVEPRGLAFDGQDRLLFADRLSERVWRLEDDGTLSLFAGSGGRDHAGDGGQATLAGMTPRALADDGAGTVWIADHDNYRVRRVGPDGVITTVAGNAGPGTESDGLAGPALDTAIPVPTALAYGAGGLFIGSNLRVRRLVGADLDLFAGNGEAQLPVADGTVASETALWDIEGIGLDAGGRLCVSLGASHHVQCVDEGLLYTVAGSGWGFDGDGGPAPAAQLRVPAALLSGGGGAWECGDADLLIGESGGHALRCVDDAGLIHTVGGTRGFPAGAPGDHGPVADAEIREPRHMARDTHGNVFVAEGSAIRRIDSAGVITTVVGPVRAGDGAFADAFLVHPQALVAMSDDRLLVADGTFGQVRLVDRTAAIVRSVAGYPGGREDEPGGAPAALSRSFRDASGMALDTAASPMALYVSERRGHVIRRILLVDPGDPSSWTLSVFAGALSDDAGASHQDGDAANARLLGPAGLALSEAEGRLYFTEAAGHTVRYVELETRAVGTLGGTAGLAAFLGEGTHVADALFDSPDALTIAPDGTLLVADTGNHRVRHIDADGIITTLAGNGIPSSIGDGAPAAAFPLRAPGGIAADDHGNVWITSTDSVRVVVSTSEGLATAVDPIHTVFGAPPRVTFPEVATSCLTGIRVAASGDRVDVLDACQGYLLELRRTTSPPD